MKISNNLKNLILLLTLFTGFQSFAFAQWDHISLTSQDGIGIVIDSQFVGGIYEPYLHQKFDVVENIWINVYGNSSGLRPIDRVDARIHNLRRQRNLGITAAWELDLSYYVKLHWNGSHFTGQLFGVDSLGAPTARFPIRSEGALGDFEYRQEISLNVYKENTLYRLIDPMSNSP